jgi:hypothetical protein
MYFKVLLSVYEISLPKDSVLEFEIKKPYPISIQLKNPPKEYLEKSSNKSVTFCDVFTILEPNDKLMGVFKKFDKSKNHLYTNSSSPNENLNAPIHLSIEQELVPHYYATYLAQIENDLMNVGKKLICLIRWTNNLLGTHNPFATRGSYWSIDNVHWYHFPRKFKTFLTSQGETIHLNARGKNKINELLENNVTEPLHHELFREAWVQRTSNPRSAMIIGISSVEVALISTLDILLPDNKRLKRKLKNKPLYKFLDECWNEMAIGNKIFQITSLPDTLLSLIKEGVIERHKIAHFGFKASNTERVEQILEGIKDLLFIVDCLSGNEFTLLFIRQETLNQLFLKKP